MEKKLQSSLAFFPVCDDTEAFQLKREFPEPLQAPPFIGVLLGSRGASKSTILSNLMLRSCFWGECKGKPDTFDQIILISPTLGQDQTGRFLAKKASATYPEYDDGIINGLIEFQSSIPKKERHHLCLILDDLTASSNYKPNSAVNRLCSIHRHLSISILFLIHRVNAIPPVVRNCYTFMHCLRMPSASEQQKLFEDHLSFLADKKQIKALYDYATAEPYNSLYVDAVKCSAWKWGKDEPEFLWKKFRDDGGYSDPVPIPFHGFSGTEEASTRT